jgi:putative FmdB family regulatory protein
MPIYEYKCGDCGHRLEAIQRVNDPALRECPACGKRELKKLISVAGFQLKGTGWYVTDFRDKDKKKSKADGAKEDSKTDSKADSKGDKKKTASTSGSNDD